MQVAHKKAHMLCFAEDEIKSLSAKYCVPTSKVNTVLSVVCSAIGSYLGASEYIYNYTGKDTFKDLKKESIVVYFLVNDFAQAEKFESLIKNNFLEVMFNEIYTEQNDYFTKSIFNPEVIKGLTKQKMMTFEWLDESPENHNRVKKI